MHKIDGACGSESIRFGPSAPGVERAEVHLSRRAFEPHRHDVYAVGITTDGVQTFRYRGARRVGLPGQLHVLHPDETHDGAAATDGGFGYRIVYVSPDLIREAIAGRALPFVADPVHDLTPATRLILSVFVDIDQPISELGRAAIATTVADVLLSLSDDRDRRSQRINLQAMRLVRDYLAAYASDLTPAATLERLAGLGRFTIARQFRRAFGMSPERYRIICRLAAARAAIESGLPLSQVAAESGFADQSHLTRQFKRTYGFSPGRWVALTRSGLQNARDA